MSGDRELLRLLRGRAVYAMQEPDLVVDAGRINADFR
jgi:hypothetical protein